MTCVEEVQMSAPTIKRAAASRIEADSAALVQLSAHGGSGIGPTIADTCQGRQGECGHGDRCAWRLPAYPCRCAWTWVMSPAVDRYMDGYSPYQRSMPRASMRTKPWPGRPGCMPLPSTPYVRDTAPVVSMR